METQEHNIYQIILQRGIDFYNNEHYQPIFVNFNPVYYMSDSWGVKVVQNLADNNQPPNLLIEICTKHRNEGQRPAKFFVQELCRKKEKDSQIQYDTIYYIFSSFSQKSQKASQTNKIEGDKVNVKFKKNVLNNTFERIDIEIHDFNQWFIKTKKMLMNKTFINFSNKEKCYLKKIISPTQIEYFYKEPDNVRNIYFDQKHFSIALQGGGAMGATYVGVYNAFLSQFGKNAYDSLKSIIGCSIGGMVSLVFCCKLSKQKVVKAGQILSQLSLRDKTEQSQLKKYGKISQKSSKIIRQFLIKYGILTPELTSLIQDILDDQNVRRLILKLMEISNCQFAEFFKDQHGNLNVDRLFTCQLMNGRQIMQATVYCLKEVFPQKPKSQLYKVNFNQLYQATQIQFTCPAVDLNDKIVRFFNHKTSPNLPIGHALQMTAAMPVAFKKPIWQKEWGKYYIHYEQTRLEKDLTGHEFVDGGVLCNFPIKHLDNDHVSPAYFSHRRNDKTELFGFGLQPRIDQQVILQKKIKKDKVIDELKDVIIKKYWHKILAKGILSKCCCFTKILSSKIWQKKKQQVKEINSISDLTSSMKRFDQQVSEQQERSQILDIPIIKLFVQMIDTYMNADINFQKQSFKNQCFNTSFDNIDKSILINWLSHYSHNQYIADIQYIIKDLEQSLSGQFVQDLICAQITVLQNLNSIKAKILSKIQKLEYECLQQAFLTHSANEVIKILGYIYQQLKDNNEKQMIQASQKLQQYLQILKKITNESLFHKAHIIHNSQTIIQIIDQLQSKTIKTIFNNEQCSNNLQKCIKRQISQKNSLISQFKKYLNEIQSKSQLKYYEPIPKSMCINWVSMENSILITNQENLEKIHRNVQKIGIPQIPITKYCWDKRHHLRSYIQHILGKSLQKNPIKNKIRPIHIIFEAKNISEFFFNQYMDYTKEYIMNFNSYNKLQRNQRFQIKAITASGYQSLVAFLFASDLSANRINQYVWKIRYCIQSNPKAYETFSKYEWANINEKLYEQIQQQVWNNKYDILGQLKTKIQMSQPNQIKQINFNEEISRMRYSRQQINQNIERVIVDIIDTWGQLQDQEMGQQQKMENIYKKLSLKGYQTKNEETNQKSKQFYQYIFDKFQDLIKYALLLNPSMNSPIFQHIQSKEHRMQAWKGIILSQTLNNIRLKVIINQILQECGHTLECTLLEFYNAKKKEQDKITAKTQRLIVINKNTRPNMPVWAAVLASSSIPHMNKPIIDTYSWKTSNSNKKNREIAKMFQQDITRKYSYLQSGNNHSKIPIEFITNRKIKEMIGSQQNQTFLTFIYDDIKTQQHPSSNLIEKIKTNPISTSDLFSIFRKYGSELSSILSINTLRKGLRSIQLHISSHNKTYHYFYRKDSIILPVKFSSLDFHELHDWSDDGTFKFSANTFESIQNAEYITEQKINNYEKGKQHNREDNRFINLRIARKKIKTENKESQRLYVQFISAITSEYFDTTQKYRIFYKITNKFPQKTYLSKQEQDARLNGFIQLKRNKIFINLNEAQKGYDKLNIKIIYPSKVGSQSDSQQYQIYQILQVYHQLDLQNFVKSNMQYKINYRLNYDYFYKKSQPLSPMGSKTKPLCVRSYDADFWTRKGHCIACNGKIKNVGRSEKQLSQRQQCYKCDSNNLIIYQCEKCLKKYCHCKFIIQRKQDQVICALGHPCKPINWQEQQKNYQACHSCQIVTKIVYKDEVCGVSMCNLCVKQKIKNC